MIKETKIKGFKIKTITTFVPAQAIEALINTHPYARLDDKLKSAIRRFLSNKSFTEGDIVETTPRLFINKVKFNPKKMGFDVIARIL